MKVCEFLLADCHHKGLIHHGTRLIDWFFLQFLTVLVTISKSTIWRHVIFLCVQLSHLYVTTGKTIALTILIIIVIKMSFFMNLTKFVLLLSSLELKLYLSTYHSSLSGKQHCYRAQKVQISKSKKVNVWKMHKKGKIIYPSFHQHHSLYLPIFFCPHKHCLSSGFLPSCFIHGILFFKPFTSFFLKISSNPSYHNFLRILLLDPFIVSLCFWFVPYLFSLHKQLHQHPSVLVIHFYIQSIFIQHIVILDPLFSCTSHASEVTHFHCTQYIFTFFPAYSPLIFI